jgi:hypothetical protein
MDYEQKYKEDVNNYIDIVQRYREIQENDIAQAFQLMKDSLQQYNRWSKIRLDVRKENGRGAKPELKDRIEEMCKYLKEVNSESRMIWRSSKEDLKENRF